KFLKNSNTIKCVFIALVTIISPFLLKQSVLYSLILSISFVMISLICLLKLQNKIVKSDSKEASALLSGIRLAPWQLMILGVSFTTLIMVNNSYA
ncbi:MFS transporter, partial [Pediococcus acidilactici]